MKLIAETCGRYCSLLDGGYGSIPNNAIGFVDESSQDMYAVSGGYVTPISFNVVTSKSSFERDIDPINQFDSDDDTNDIRSLITRHTLGSVHYRKGLRRHDYNGVYHAKVEGSVTYRPLPSASHTDANVKNQANFINPWTGQMGGPRAFVTLLYGVDASGSCSYRCYNYQKPYDGGWRTVDARWNASWTDVSTQYGSAKALIITLSYSVTMDKSSKDHPTYGVYTNTLGTVLSNMWNTILFKNGTPVMDNLSDGFGNYASQQRGVNVYFTQTDDASVWADALAASRDPAFAKEFAKNFYSYSRISYIYDRYFYNAVSPSTEIIDLDADSLRGLTGRLVDRLNNSQLQREPDFHDLAARAYQDIGMWNGNGLLYVNDAAHLASDTRDFVKTLKSLKRNVKKGRLPAAVKDAARTFLSIHYGYRLSIKDTRSLIKVLEDPRCDGSTMKAQASETFTTSDNRGWSWEVTARYQIFYNAMTQNNLLSEFIHLLDLVPDLENIWDMVPYSFVVDWFVNLGDLFAAMDNYHEICSRYDVEAAGRSTKYVCMLNADMLGLSRYADANLVFSVYYRGYSTSATIPIPSTLINPTNPFTHSVEAGALLVSK